MKRINQLILLVFAILLTALTASAQGTVKVGSGATVPTNCTPKANNGLFYKNTGANIGLYECTAANTWTFRGSISFGGALTPTALSGDVNNYNPTGLSSSFAIRINGGAADRNISGMATGAEGRLVEIINIGSTNTLTLVNQSASSTAANRFLFGADVVIGINQSVVVRYDGTTGRWRPFTQVLTSSGATAGSYGPATITVDAAGRVTAASASTVTAIEAPLFCSDAGVSDTYACSLSPIVAAYVTGTHYRFKANSANTGAASINFNSIGATTIKKVAGGITTDLATNDILAGQWVDVVYDGTNMQMQSLLGNAPPAATAPGGVATQVQFNDDDVFGGDSGLTFNKTSNVLFVTGIQSVGSAPYLITSDGAAGLAIQGNKVTVTGVLHFVVPNIKVGSGDGNMVFSPGTPGIAGNGTLNTNSKDSAGKVTATATATSTIVLTFSAAFSNAPACSVTNETTAVLARGVSTTTTLTIAGELVSGDVLSYQCLGY